MYRFWLALITCTVACSALADADSTSALLKHLDQYKTLEVSFSQQVLSDKNEVIQHSTGHFVVQKPGLFHWETNKPFEQVVVSDGKTLWLHDPDLQQVVIKPFAGQLANTPAMIFTATRSEIEARFDIVLKKGTSGVERFELTPREAKPMFRTIALEFSKNKPSQLLLLDSLGQQTTLALTEVKLDPTVDAALFTLKIPPGTDVIDETGAASH